MAPYTSARTDVAVDRLQVSAYTVPTETPQTDGTLGWTSTTLVVVKAEGGGTRGLGYTYADVATARLADDLREVVTGVDAMAVTAAWHRMVRAIRNLGRPGIASMAMAAIDIALWDLKARLLGVPLAVLLGLVRESIPAYGSGGFTSADVAALQCQLRGWAEDGLRMVKMKVGREPREDPDRVAAARQAIGGQVALFVDANGAYSRKQALELAWRFGAHDVSWFEEPVTFDDLEGLRFLRDHAPSDMEIAAGEYGYDLFCFDRMLAAGAVDVLQPDATRCAGVTGFLEAAVLCRARHVPLSAHTAPSLHTHLCCATAAARHAEYFHDHARIEQLLFDGARVPAGGDLRPDMTRPGLGLELKAADAERFAV